MNKKKYGYGSPSVEDPSTALAQNDINIAKASYEGFSNPWVLGLQGLNAGLGLIPTDKITASKDKFRKEMDEEQVFANGGVVKSKKVEIEGEEVIETPDGDVTQAKGPSHEEGGIDAILPQGTKIYSDRIEIGNKTMQERKLAREKKLNKASKLKDGNPSDRLLNDSYDRLKMSTDKEDADDLQLQEFIKAFKGENGGKRTAKFGEDGEDDTGWLGWNGLPAPKGKLNNPWLNSETPNFNLGKPNPFEMTSNPNTVQHETKESLNYTAPVNTSIGTTGTGAVNTTGIDGVDNTDDTKKKGFNFNSLPIGDLMGLAGQGINTFGPLMNTLKTRGMDTPNINYMKDFGKGGLETLNASKDYLDYMMKSNLKDLESARTGAIKRGRNTARGINTARALDLGTEANVNREKTNVYNKYAASFMDLLNRQAGMENQRDNIVMRGDAAKDLADRQDKDNFRTQLGKDTTRVGTGLQEMGSSANQIKFRQDNKKAIAEYKKGKMDAAALLKAMGITKTIKNG